MCAIAAFAQGESHFYRIQSDSRKKTMVQEIGRCCCVQEAAGLDLQPQVSEQKRLTPAKPIDMNYKRGIRSQIKTRVENRGEESRN